MALSRLKYGFDSRWGYSNPYTGKSYLVSLPENSDLHPSPERRASCALVLSQIFWREKWREDFKKFLCWDGDGTQPAEIPGLRADSQPRVFQGNLVIAALP